MEIPSLQEWKRNNPGKSLNDYYKQYPNGSGTNSSVNPSNQVLKDISDLPSKSDNQKSTNIVSLIVSLMIFGSFFLPWIEIRFIGIMDIVSSTGFELPKVLENLFGEIPVYVFKSIYIIPVCAFAVLIAESQNSWMKVIPQTIAVLTLAYWMYFLNQLIYLSGIQLGVQLNPTDYYAEGFYVSVLGCAYYLFDVIMGYFR